MLHVDRNAAGFDADRWFPTPCVILSAVDDLVSIPNKCPLTPELRSATTSFVFDSSRKVLNSRTFPTRSSSHSL